MKLPSTEPHTRVEITWADCTFEDQTATYETIREAVLAVTTGIRKTLGYWVGTKKIDGYWTVIIATDDDRKRALACAGVISIPLGMVLRIEVLGPTEGASWIAEFLREKEHIE